MVGFKNNNYNLICYTIGHLTEDLGNSLLRVKLSNFGNTLKLLILSYICKSNNFIGWNKYSYNVTNQKINKNLMGNRGSKSVILKSNNIIVKEQRVYGSWCVNNLSHLRCTLMGFERNYQVKILSNQIIQRRFYSIESFKSNFILQTEPWFISGFSDAEGCFLVIVRKSKKMKFGWQIEVNFSINFHIRDIDLLKLIQIYFDGAGRIGKERNSCCDYTVGSLDQIVKKVIPHFEKYPLKTKKYSDYLLFKEVVLIIQRGEHLTKEGLQKIINIRASLNKGLTTTLIEAFHNTINFPRQQVPLKNAKLNPHWIAGFYFWWWLF